MTESQLNDELIKSGSKSILKYIHKAEDYFLVAILLGMAILPLIEIIYRNIATGGIPGSSVIVQYLTLFVAFAGAALAAREGRLLSLTSDKAIFTGKFGDYSRYFAAAIGSSVSVGLLWASWNMVKVDYEYPIDIILGVPNWLVELIMPIAMGVIAFRIMLKSSPDLKIRLIIIGTVLLFALMGNSEILQESSIFILGFVFLFASIAFGAPIFVGLGGAALLLFWHAFEPIAAIPAESLRIVVSPTLPTIPLFTLSGYFLAESNAAHRLVGVFRAWFGWLPGGMPIVTVIVCAFFTTFTGGSGVTILALGGLLLPMLIKDKYPEKFSVGLLTASGSLGLFFPPSLAVILYGVISHTPINEIFIGGIVPGIILMIFIGAWGVRQGLISKIPRTTFNINIAFKALWVAKYEVALPIVVLVGIYGGFTTLVETAALAALYALVVEVFIHKDLSLKEDVPRVIVLCSILIGGVLIILSVAMGLTAYLVDAEVPMLALEWVQDHVESRWVFLLSLNALLLVVGTLMDIFSAIVVVVPLITPMALSFGIEPVHLAIIFLANLELGFLTPPVGMNLFLASYRFDKELLTVYKSAIPYLIILLIGVIAITYVPILTLGLGRLLGY